MRNEHRLNLIIVTTVIALHGLLILVMWHTSKPKLDINAPVMSFVDLDNMDLGSGAKADQSEPSGAPAAAPARTKPQPKIKPAPAPKPTIKPVIKANSKPDIQQAVEKPRVVKPIVHETPEKVVTPVNQVTEKTAQHTTIADNSESGSGSSKGRNDSKGSGSGSGSGSGHGGGDGSGSGNGAGGGSGSGGGTTQPTYKASYLNNPKPPYPALSRENGEEGTVILSVTVEPNGTASRVNISRSSGYSRLDHSAQTAVAKYRFKPATRGGIAISYTYTVPINFSLR